MVKLFLTNVPTQQADSFARQLVEERLAACINQFNPVRSFYWWEGHVQCENECTLLIKTSLERSAELLKRIKELHPYELPEILALDIDATQSFEKYLHWVQQETTPQDKSD